MRCSECGKESLSLVVYEKQLDGEREVVEILVYKCLDCKAYNCFIKQDGELEQVFNVPFPITLERRTNYG